MKDPNPTSKNILHKSIEVVSLPYLPKYMEQVCQLVCKIEYY